MASVNEHEGHRERLRRRFIEYGLDGFEPHEALELMLFYAIPRRDTNPLAHRLLNRYITIAGVCDAPIDELQKDFGLSQNAAAFLKLLPQMSRLYVESKLNGSGAVNPDTVGDLLTAKFIGRTTEVVALLLCDAKGKIIYCDVVATGSINNTDVPIRKIVDAALRQNAKTAYVAHNHPSGSAMPSKSDIEATRVLSATLKSVGVRLADHFVVADGDYVSMRESALFDEMKFGF